VDIDAEEQEATTSGDNGPLQNIETEFDEKSASNKLVRFLLQSLRWDFLLFGSRVGARWHSGALCRA
jgi:hypothetical protein